ncbi:MAG: hypothetical protein ABSF69_05390 [Polyangiaceae bacterium]
MPWVALACWSCSASARDVVPASRDEVVELPTSARSPGGYDYVARGPLAVVALAEARGIAASAARAAVDRLASALDMCVRNRERGSDPIHGAARVIAQIAQDGTVAATSIRIDPGAAPVDIAVICLLAPTRMLTFGPADAGARGLAIEAIWGPGTP